MRKAPTPSLDTLRVYWRATRPYGWVIFGMYLSMAIAVTAGLIAPLYYKEFFDVISTTAPSADNQLFSILISILIVNGISWLGYRATDYFDAYIQSRIETDLLQRSFSYLLGQSYSFFANNFAGALVQKVSRLGRAFRTFSDRLLWSMVPLVLRTLGVLAVLWTINPGVAAVFGAWALVFLIVNYSFSLWKLKFDTERAARDSATTAALADTISNHATVQSFTGTDQETSRYKEVTERLFKFSWFTWNLSATAEAVQGGLMVLIEFALFYYALTAWQAGTLSVGTFVLIQVYLFQVLHSLWDFGRTIRQIYGTFGDAREMVEILNTPHEIVDAPGAKQLVVDKGEIVFSKVRYGYQRKQTVLNNLSLTVAPGEKIGLIGVSGAGKSTLTKVLFRFHDIQGGTITIDGQNIHEVTQDSLRGAIGFVPQEPLLFHRTILENIRYGRPAATDSQVYEAASLAHCDEFIRKLPGGYATYVGERGIKLSGGERQRVAIARAILKDAPILVLDEATSSLDSHSEVLIQDALKHLMANKTVIVIAHRLSTIRTMDRIVVMLEGSIVEQGRHDQLIRRKRGLYRKLWDLQAGGFIQDDADTPA